MNDKVFQLMVIRALVLLISQLSFNPATEDIALQWLDDASKWSEKLVNG